MTEASHRTALEAALSQVTEQALSGGERAAHVALTLFAAAMFVGLGGLLLTEPDLPLRTALSIGVMVAIAAAWVAYGLRVLSRRRPLLVNREVIAGRMAVLFTALFTAGTMWVGWMVAGHPVTPATWLGVTTLAVAVINLTRAQMRRRRLLALRERLERELREAV
jgi:hypothetical protein